MIRPYESRGSTAGIAIVAVLISAVVFLGIIIAITGTLSLSSRQSTGDQRVTLEAQYASESGLSRVMAEAETGPLKQWTQLITSMQTPTTTAESLIKQLAKQFCNVSTTTVTFPCVANNSTADVTDRYQVFAEFLKTTDYNILPAAERPATTAAELTYWKNVFADGPNGTSVRYTSNFGNGVRYDVSFGMQALGVTVVSGSYYFRFAPRDVVSTGVFTANGKPVSTRATSRSFKDVYELRLTPPSFAFFLSLTDSQTSVEPNGTQQPVFLTTNTLLDGPVFTNGTFNYAGNPWMSDNVISAGCGTASLTAANGCGTALPNGRDGIYNDGNLGNASDNRNVTTAGDGYAQYPGYTTPGLTAPQFARDNTTAQTTAGRPWQYTGTRNADVQTLPVSAEDQRVMARDGLTPTFDKGIYVNTESPLVTPGLYASGANAPQITLMATDTSRASNSTTIVPFEAVDATDKADNQFIRIQARKLLSNCPALATGINLSPSPDITAAINNATVSNTLVITASVSGPSNFTPDAAPVSQNVSFSANPGGTLTGAAGTPIITANTYQYGTIGGFQSDGFTITASKDGQTTSTTQKVNPLTPVMSALNATVTTLTTPGQSTRLSTSRSSFAASTGDVAYALTSSVSGNAPWTPVSGATGTITVASGTTAVTFDVAPTVSTTYRIIATGPTGLQSVARTRTITVNVPPLRVIVSTVSPANEGDSLTYPTGDRPLQWTVTGGVAPYTYSGLFRVPNHNGLSPNPTNTTLPSGANLATSISNSTGSFTVRPPNSTGLTDAKYSYYVVAQDSTGAIAWDWDNVTVAPPTAPDFNLSKSITAPPGGYDLPYGGGSVDIGWTAASGTPNSVFTFGTGAPPAAAAAAESGSSSSAGSKNGVRTNTTTTYYVTAKNTPGQSATKDITVYVAPPPPITVIFTADSYWSATSPLSTTLRWNVTGATTVTIDNRIGPVALIGSQGVRVNQTTTYNLTATNTAGDQVIASVTLTIGGSPTPPPPPLPIIDFFNPETPVFDYSGGATNLRWGTTNATSILLERVTTVGSTLTPSNALDGTTPASVNNTTGSQQDYVYRLTASNAAGSSVSATTSIRVTAPNRPVATITASPSSVPFANPITQLTWNNTAANTGDVTYTVRSSTDGGTTWNPANVVTNTASTGPVSFTVSRPTVFEVVAKGVNSGLSSAPVRTTVTVATPVPPTVTLNVPSPATMTFGGGDSVLRWAGAGDGTLTYTLRRKNPGGSFADVPGAVNTASLTDTEAVTQVGVTEFQVVVTSSLGGTSNSNVRTVTVSPPAPPAITSFTGPTAALPFGGGNAPLNWVVSGTGSLTQTITGVGTVTGNNRTVNPTTTTTYTLSVTDSYGQSANPTKSVTVNVEAGLIGLSGTGTANRLDAATATSFDPSWSVSPQWGSGTRPTLVDSDYTATISPAISTALPASSRPLAVAVNAAGKVTLMVGPLPSGVADQRYTITVTLNKAGPGPRTATFTIDLTREAGRATLRPRARLTQAGSCAANDRVQYQWNFYLEYMIEKSGTDIVVYERTYPSQSQNAWVPTPTVAWSPSSRKFNGVVYVEGGLSVAGPPRRDPLLPATASPAVAAFAAMTIATNGNVQITNDLQYEVPTCSTPPTRNGDGTVTPATCKARADWARNALGIYTSNGNVQIATTLRNMTLHAITMASQGQIEVLGVPQDPAAPGCPPALQSGNNLNNINIQGGLIQENYGQFSRVTQGIGITCGYGRSMTYDKRMQFPEYAPPGFPKANNATWKIELIPQGSTVALTGADRLPLTSSFSRLK